MITKGQILYFTPPKFADGTSNANKRLMLIIDVDNDLNTVSLLNITKLFGKARQINWRYNKLIKNFYPPLPVPSFVKLDSIYIVENFSKLKRALYSSGDMINNNDFKSIIKARKEYIAANGSCSDIYFSKQDLIPLNSDFQ